MNVRSFMTPNAETVLPTDMLSSAQEKMQRGRFRRLPVVDAAGNLLGIVTDGDLRQHHGYLATTRVTAAMTEKAVTIGADEPIEAAAELMLNRKIGGLPVVEADGTLVGIITETDLVRAFLKHLRGAGRMRG